MIVFAPVPHLAAILDRFCEVSEYLLLPVLFVLALRRKIHRKLRFFVFYLLFASAREIALAAFGQFPAIGDRLYYPYIYSYYGAGFILSFLRLFITFEICQQVLRRYPTLKVFTWRIIATLAVALFSWTFYFAIRNIHHIRKFILTFQQTTDVSFALLLLTLLGIGAYYRMRIPPLFRLILIGSCIYSAVQVVNSELGRYIVDLPYSVVDFAQRLTYNLMLSIWVWAVWRWGNDPTPPPELIPQATYDQLAPQVHDRLRDLNDSLSDFMGKRRRDSGA
jgi:hypothetical protein